jgi:pimeloyl-ACP methyl ester carboxylesterase
MHNATQSDDTFIALISLTPLIRRLLPVLPFLLLAVSATAAQGSTPPPLGELVDIGGYRVHLYCTGAGNPTVMIIGGGFSFDWGLVQPQVANFARVCTYDPSGTAWSDPVPTGTLAKPVSVDSPPYPKCSARIDEIHALLQRASIKRPLVLVGFSIGALFARLYAAEYPAEVAGIVIVDHAFIDPGTTPQPTAPRAHAQAPPDASGVDSPPVLISQTPITLGIEDDENFRKLPQLDQDLHSWAMSNHPVRPTAAAAAECISEVETATHNDAYPLGNTPLVVISTTNDSPKYQQLQTKLFALSRNARHVVAENSSHMVIVDEPQIIVSAVQQIAYRIRASSTFVPK